MSNQKINEEEPLRLEVRSQSQQNNDVEEAGETIYQIDIKNNQNQVDPDQILNFYKPAPKDLARKISKTAKSQFIKRKSNSEKPPQTKKIPFGHLDEKTRDKVQKITKNFRAMFKVASYDTQVTRLRYEGKQKLFHNCWYGIEELRTLNHDQLNENQKKLISMEEKDASSFIRKITIQIDNVFLSILNKLNKVHCTKQFKNQWTYLTDNIRDDRNQQLRRNILNRKFSNEWLAQCKQIDLYTTAKRQQIQKKQRSYLAQFEAGEKYSRPMQTEEIVEDRSFLNKYDTVPIIEKKQSSKKSKYIDEATVDLLKNFAQGDFITKLKTRIEEDLVGDMQQKLLLNLQLTFPS